MLKEKIKKTLVICLAFLMFFMQGCIDDTDNYGKNGNAEYFDSSVYKNEDYIDTDESEKITDEEVTDSEEREPHILPDEKTEEQEEDENLVYITDTGECYHRESCYHLKSKTEVTISRAKALGLRPCSKCNPPE